MKILIVEDEIAAARRLEKMILELRPDTEILQRLDTVEGAVQWLQSHTAPDLLMLDIQLADGSSFEIFDHTEVKCPVIFTTAYDEYALQAFKVNTVDYLLKPIKLSELQTALDKYSSNFQPERLVKLLDDIRQHKKSSPLRRMLIRLGAHIKLVDLNDAAFFYTRDKITFVVLKSSGKRLPVDYPLDKLELMLDPEKFFRINRQMIVQITAIREMFPYSKSRIKVELEHGIEQDSIVSTERAAAFKKWLTGETD